MLLESDHESQYYQSLLDDLKKGKKLTVTQAQHNELTKRFESESIPANVSIIPTPDAGVDPNERAGGNS